MQPESAEVIPRDDSGRYGALSLAVTEKFDYRAMLGDRLPFQSISNEPESQELLFRIK